jgi:hypothetical protein
VDTSQVIDLLSRAHIWEWKDLLLSCHGFRLFFGPTVKGRLLGRKSNHHTEGGPAMLGAWSPSLDGDLDPLTGVKQVGLAGT